MHIKHTGILADSRNTPMGYTEGEWDETMAVNLRTPWLLTKSIVRQMQQTGHGGSIIYVSSITGLGRGYFPGVSVHGAALAALHQLAVVRTLLSPLDAVKFVMCRVQTLHLNHPICEACSCLSLKIPKGKPRRLIKVSCIMMGVSLPEGVSHHAFPFPLSPLLLKLIVCYPVG